MPRVVDQISKSLTRNRYKSTCHFYRKYGAVLTALLAGLMFFQVARAAITLLYFIAIIGSGRITLKWETATELNNAGFFVQRSPQQTGNFTRINSTIIPAQGDSLLGAIYQYDDNNVVNGITYWYRLESVDNNGQSVYTDPVQATAGTTPTPTPTKTATPAQTGTQTSTSDSRPTTGSAIVSVTPTPTRTVTPQTAGSATATKTNFPTASLVAPTKAPLSPTPSVPVLGTPIPLPTWRPFPTITLIFPQTETPEVLFSAQWSPEQPALVKSSLSVRMARLIRYWPVALLVLLWIGVIIWFVHVQRTFHEE